MSDIYSIIFVLLFMKKKSINDLVITQLNYVYFFLLKINGKSTETEIKLLIFFVLIFLHQIIKLINQLKSLDI